MNNSDVATTERPLVKFEKTKGHTVYKTTGGSRVPGVTTIINSSLGWNKNVLMAWQRKELLAGRDPNKVRDQAADIGTLTHFMIECHIKGAKPDTSEFSKHDIDKAENGFLGFLEWESKYSPHYIHSEFGFVNTELMYGGTVDAIARKNGSLWLIDLKTSKGVYVDHKLQVAAYKFGYEKATGTKTDEVHILQLNKNTGAFSHHPIPISELEICWLAFIHCKALYDLKRITDSAVKKKQRLNPHLYQAMINGAREVSRLLKMAA